MSADLVLSRDDRSVTVRSADVELFTYVHRPTTARTESPKPYLHPVRTPTGDVMTHFRPVDHPWHHGLAWALPNVGTANFWGGPTYFRGEGYRPVDNHGRMEHRAFTELSALDGCVRIGHRLSWTGPGGGPVIDERRTLTASMVGPSAWMLVIATAMTNVSGEPVVLGSPGTRGRPGAGYGGLFWRGPRSFSSGRVQSPAGEGGDELRGTRSGWLGFEGRHDGSGRTSRIVLVAEPDDPPQWFVRVADYVGLGPAPFFTTESTLPAGSVATFRYAVLVADGDGPPTDRLAAHGARALTDNEGAEA